MPVWLPGLFLSCALLLFIHKLVDMLHHFLGIILIIKSIVIDDDIV